MDTKEIWTELLGKLRLLALYYQTAHWQSKNPLFYADHLLLDRLYNSVNAELDGVGERAVGTTDSSAVNLLAHVEHLSQNAVKLPTECKENAVYFSAALMLEQELLEFLENSESTAGMSLGSKNLLADLADSHEANVYLLKQRLAK
jgi:DNA-binding ferritin-like protein